MIIINDNHEWRGWGWATRRWVELAICGQRVVVGVKGLTMTLWRLVLIAAVVLAGGSARRPPFTSTKAPAGIVLVYENGCIPSRY